MRVLIIEDNHYHAEALKEKLFNHFQEIEIGVFGTEYDTYNNMGILEKSGLDIIILDMILPWCNPMSNMPEAPEGYDSPYNAGIRCMSIFLNNSNFKNVPIIIYSVLDRKRLMDDLKTIPSNVFIVGKKSSFDDMALKIESIVLGNQPARKKMSTKQALLDSSEFKIGIKGFEINLKDFFRIKQ